MLFQLADCGPKGLDAGLHPHDPGDVFGPELISIDDEVEESGDALVSAREDLADFTGQAVTALIDGDVGSCQQAKPLGEQVEGAFAHDQDP